MVMMFSTNNGDIITVRANSEETHKCYALSLKVAPTSSRLLVTPRHLKLYNFR